MAKAPDRIFCRVKYFRQREKQSQAQLAESVGIKRQAVYDIESGKYLPNTGVALRLARHFGCRVEDLFSEDTSLADCPVVMGEKQGTTQGRVSVVKVRDQLVAYPVDGSFLFSNDLRPADGVLGTQDGAVRFFGTETLIQNSILIMGCDPAFSLLAAHVGRVDPKLRMMCRFSSTYSAIDRLVEGKTHLAGIHLHSRPGEEANVILAREKLSATGAVVVGYSVMEEGFMVAPKNPAAIKCAADLARSSVRFVNREPGAALRILLDDALEKAGIPPHAISGYTREVRGHSQGAQLIACGGADAALGLRPVARAYGLDFVPIAEVRCDLVVPADLLHSPQIQVILNVIQSRDLRDEISLIPGYSPDKTGKTIASF
jgi:putative molybdopterin biosynthesis protein